jgi:hypothetical protein
MVSFLVTDQNDRRRIKLTIFELPVLQQSALKKAAANACGNDSNH